MLQLTASVFLSCACQCFLSCAKAWPLGLCTSTAGFPDVNALSRINYLGYVFPAWNPETPAVSFVAVPLVPQLCGSHLFIAITRPINSQLPHHHQHIIARLSALVRLTIHHVRVPARSSTTTLAASSHLASAEPKGSQTATDAVLILVPWDLVVWV